jgi:hypothetical protein
MDARGKRSVCEPVSYKEPTSEDEDEDENSYVPSTRRTREAAANKPGVKIRLCLLPDDEELSPEDFVLLRVTITSDKCTFSYTQLLHCLLFKNMIAYEEDGDVKSVCVLVPRDGRRQKQALKKIQAEAKIIGIAITTSVVSTSREDALEPLFAMRVQLAGSLLRVKLSTAHWYHIDGYFHHQLW